MPLVKWRKQAEEAAAKLPALLVQAEEIANAVMTGDHPRKRAGLGEQFWQYRPYEAGDPIANIDWRQSAKSDTLYIKQREQQNAQTTLFWCHAAPSMAFSSQAKLMSKRDAACVISLALAIFMKRGGERVGLIDGAYGVEAMGEELLAAQDTDINTLKTALIPQNASVVLCGDFLDDPEEINTLLKHFAAHQARGILIQILDPAELTLPYRGRAIFEDGIGQQFENVENIDDIRAAYCAKINAHTDAIADICQHYGWGYVMHRTDHAPSDTLGSLWQIIHQGAR